MGSNLIYNYKTMKIEHRYFVFWNEHELMIVIDEWVQTIIWKWETKEEAERKALDQYKERRKEWDIEYINSKDFYSHRRVTYPKTYIDKKLIQYRVI